MRCVGQREAKVSIAPYNSFLSTHEKILAGKEDQRWNLSSTRCSQRRSFLPYLFYRCQVYSCCILGNIFIPSMQKLCPKLTHNFNSVCQQLHDLRADQTLAKVDFPVYPVDTQGPVHDLLFLSSLSIALSSFLFVSQAASDDCWLSHPHMHARSICISAINTLGNVNVFHLILAQ
jgi:hypothetical protein